MKTKKNATDKQMVRNAVIAILLGFLFLSFIQMAEMEKAFLDEKVELTQKNIELQKEVSLLSDILEQALDQMVNDEKGQVDSLHLPFENVQNCEPSFAKAVAILESGWNHESKMAQEHNNIFGLMYNGKPMNFDSVEDCISYFDGLMGRMYQGMTLEEIGAKYCPANPSWAKNVRCIMEKL